MTHPNTPLRAQALTRATFATLAFTLAISPSQAYDVTDQFSINALLAAGGQCQDGSGAIEGDEGGLTPFNDTCRGALPIQLEFSLRPTERDEFFAAVGYAVNNGLNEVSPFMLAPWAADLEDDVKDINGRSRDYLLQAWYRHTFTLAEDASLAATFGIIDSTVYLDDNAYANDEYTQFMNEAFVNSGGYSLPSYDAGAALELAIGQWDVKAVALDVGENDDGNGYQFWGGQIGYRAQNALGEGQYRALITRTSNDFFRPLREESPAAEDPLEEEAAGEGDMAETDLGAAPEGPRQTTSLTAYGLSFDQAIGAHLGAFLRLTRVEHKDILDYRGLYTGGLQIGGGLWGREADTIGIAYGYLDGANQALRHTQVTEAYYRLAMNDHFALTADVQYMADNYRETDDIRGWVVGLRAVAEF